MTDCVQTILRSEEIDCEMVFEDRYVWIIKHGFEQSSLDLSPRHISCVNDPVMRVTTFSRQMQVTVLPVIKRCSHRNQLADPLRPFCTHNLRRRNVQTMPYIINQ